MRPSFVIGGDVTDVGTGAQWTGSPWFVVEADESDGTHLELPLHGTILTNVEVDHLDHYGDFDGIVEGFDRYLGQIVGPKVVCGDDPIAAGARESPRCDHLRAVRRRRRARRRRHTDRGRIPVHHRADRSAGRTPRRDRSRSHRRHRAAAAWRAQRGQRHRCGRHGAGGRRRAEARRERARQVRRCRPPVRHPRRRRGCDVRRRLRPSADRDRRGARRCPRRAATTGSACSRSSSRIGTTASPRSGPTTPTRSSMPTSSC